MAELCPSIARASTGSPTVELLAAADVTAGQVASVPDEPVCPALLPVVPVDVFAAPTACCAA